MSGTDDDLKLEGHNSSGALLEKLRDLVRNYTEKQRYKTALFWADKVASLSKYEVQDVYNLAKCMYFTEEYERAAVLIKKSGLHEKFNAFRYMAAKCYAQSKEWQLALELLEDSTMQVIPKKLSVESKSVSGVPTNKDMLASILLLKGDIYEAKDTRHCAAQCYEEALHVDVFCYEAYDRLISHQLLTPTGEQELLESLPLSSQCQSDEEKELIKFLYGTKIKKYTKPLNFQVPCAVDHLHENLDVVASLAERHYYNCEFRSSYKITTGILSSDPYHPQCLPLHIVLLVSLKKSNELFLLSHKLVKLYPNNAVAWFAVGCYYLLQPRSQELARRYLLKATMLDKMYGPAWLALGHSFAVEGEHDQAMTAYFTATQLMKGSHLPYLYSGMEYSVTNNISLTEKFFSVALTICPDDPHTLHEIGVASYSTSNYPIALKYFDKALELLNHSTDEIRADEWEALLNNLGHVHRKLRNFQLALEYHQQALVLAPQCAQTYSSVGFILAYLDRYDEALEYLHKALGLQQDDVFSVNLTEHIMTQLASVESAPKVNDAFSNDVEHPPPLLCSCGIANIPDDVSPTQDLVMGFLPGQGGNIETPCQLTERIISAEVSQSQEHMLGYQTPEDYVVGHPSDLPPLRKGIKKIVPKTRRVISSPIPFETPDSCPNPSGTIPGGLATAQTSCKMLALYNESGDDGSSLSGRVLMSDDPSAGESSWRGAQVEDGHWHTDVLHGGGGDFPQSHLDPARYIVVRTPARPDFQDASLQDDTGQNLPAVGSTLPRSQGYKRSRDDSELSDMELDDALD